MRIIVEGPDGAGKTRLIKYLSEQTADFGPHYLITNEKGPEANFEVWWRDMLRLHLSVGAFFHDRFFYSELVYGPVIRGFINAKPETVEEVRSYLRNFAFLIYARPSWAALLEGARVEPQMEGVAEKFGELVQAYDLLMAEEKPHYGERFIQYDWQVPGTWPVLEKVRRYLAGELV